MDYRATPLAPAMAMFEEIEKRNEKKEAESSRRTHASPFLLSFLFSIFSFLCLLAAGCATSNKSVEQTQLAAARANAAADRAEASAANAEKAAHNATIAADRVEKTVRADSKAIDADVARINYLIAQQERRRRRRRKAHWPHHTPPAAAPLPTSVRGTESDYGPGRF
jgi:chemotaxis protein histidine kinase CheA